MLRQGPIPRLIHGVLEYIAGLLLIVAPFGLAFESDPAVAFSIVVGLLILALAAVSAGPTAIVQQVPVPVHVALDFLLVPVLVAAPFLFGFNDETAPTALFIGLGVVHLLLTIGTRFRPTEPAPAADEGRRRRS